MIRKIVALALALVVSTSASASDNYLYWSYWLSDGETWSAANQGAGTIPTTDGSVQGWRFVETGVGLDPSMAPQVSPEFQDLCPQLVEKKPGLDRVALVIDFGTVDSVEDNGGKEIRIECMEVATGTRSIEMLYDVAEIRENAGFICAIENYPATGCGEAKTEVVAKSEPTTPAASNSYLYMAGAGVLGLIILRLIRKARKQ